MSSRAVLSKAPKDNFVEEFEAIFMSATEKLSNAELDKLEAKVDRRLEAAKRRAQKAHTSSSPVLVAARAARK